MIDCGRHTRREVERLDALSAAILGWRERQTLRFLCATCGREVQEAPGQHTDPYPVCCDWQMVELFA